MLQPSYGTTLVKKNIFNNLKFVGECNQPWTPAGHEEDDDDQEHLDDLLPALVDLVGLAQLVKRSGAPETCVESF